MTGMALLTAIALAGSTASAAGPTVEASPAWRGLVVVLAPPVDDAVTRNALARISGELAAAPFKTITTTIDPDRDVMAQVETAGSDQSATAAFAIVRDSEPGSDRVTIWVSNRISGTTTMQRMQVEGGGDVDRAAARLAVETVELVRASLAGLWPSPHPAAETAEKAAASRPPRLALAVAIGQVRDFGDARAFWMPQIAATYAPTAPVGVRLTASGLGPSASVTALMGSARLERAMVSLGLVHAFRSDQTVQPIVGIAAGVHHLSAHGTAVSSSQPPAHDLSTFSALATASAGVAVALAPRVAVLVEADMMVIAPTLAVHVGSAEVATIDRVSLYTHAGLLASF
jgi:hypothetical protein